jgi:uncharacterized RDD family membrane protein YckC
MNWFYVQNGAQAGPVDDSQLDDLLRAGTVTSDSLVWREGMATWEPYRVARATPAFGAAPPAFPTLADTGIHPDTEVVQLAGANVCANCKPIALQRMREGTWIAGARRYGGFWIRVAAMIIDSLIVGVAFYAVFIPLGLVFGFANFDTDSPNFAAIGIALGLIILVGALVSFGYQIFFLTKYGATPGKLLLGLKVIRSDGGPITAGRAVGRMFAHALSHMILYIGYIVAAFDKEKRALHDHVCDTRVIYKS